MVPAQRQTLTGWHSADSVTSSLTGTASVWALPIRMAWVATGVMRICCSRTRAAQRSLCRSRQELLDQHDLAASAAAPTISGAPRRSGVTMVFSGGRVLVVSQRWVRLAGDVNRSAGPVTPGDGNTPDFSLAMTTDWNDIASLLPGTCLLLGVRVLTPDAGVCCSRGNLATERTLPVLDAEVQQ
ncbi:Os02g0702351 [Oryza sativa Japonica Group]|uniref:Os02g0702351 protein n=1 Tax=Oryza sativa subsp. japonica TaxID=39947 RepID=A0A0P0VNI7_ORYSJ|nr:Os02g0702351 [Oryza sativa Japonica Group]